MRSIPVGTTCWRSAITAAAPGGWWRAGARPTSWGTPHPVPFSPFHCRTGEQIMRRNTGIALRSALLIVGVMILGLYGALTPPWRYITLIGLLPLGSALTGF